MTKQTISAKPDHLKTLLLGVQTPYNRIKDIQAHFDEFLSLIKTRELEYEQTLFIKIRKIDKANFLTKGKLKELLEFCQKNEIEKIVFSEALSPLQERNIEEMTGCQIWDREKLILEIFHAAAHSAEGKIQVEMAEIEYLKTRLAGKGIELAQQLGVVGTKGPGETSKEVLKRHLAEQYRRAKKKLDKVKHSKEIQRKKRLESHIPFICLVGYTNAGKSSLLNILTKSHVEVANKLFATLDTTTRELFIDGEKKALISDTVGFISQLPHHLIEAFKSTLDELQYSNLLLHVVDIDNPVWKEQIKVVQETLEKLDVHQKILYVFNKKDKKTLQELENLEPELQNYKSYVLIHTKSKDGIQELIEFLKNYKFE